jgi:hypothetical protein
MAENPIIVGHKEIAELIVKQQGIHEGLWGLFLRFGLQAANIPFQGRDGSQIRLFPAAVLPILEIGIQPFGELNDLCVDAAVVNPKPRGKQGKKAATSKTKKK